MAGAAGGDLAEVDLRLVGVLAGGRGAQPEHQVIALLAEGEVARAVVAREGEDPRRAAL
ncbi:MAG: hypothetical protein HC897_12280, partial [Thermoanaerobaculia bacterium]|nr:hypothetical protein [Thermoanaerobaculia bacterium]